MWVETVEGPYALSRCLNPEFCCPLNGDGMCKFHAIYDDISEMVREKPKAVRFSDLREINPPLFWQRVLIGAPFFLCLGANGARIQYNGIIPMEGGALWPAPGILPHITSLAIPMGVGTLDREACRFLDFLERCG